MQLPFFSAFSHRSSSSSSSSTLSTSSLSLLLLLSIPSAVSAVTFDCDHVRADGKSYNFKELAGLHTANWVERDFPPAVYNYTWLVNLCEALPKKYEGWEGKEFCPEGTRVCGMKLENDHVEGVITAAREYIHDGKYLEPKTRAWKEATKDDGTPSQSGLEVEFHGGLWGKQEHMTVIKFTCDPKRTGNEGNEKTKAANNLTRREGEGEGDKKEDGDKKDPEEEDRLKNSLRFVSYGVEGPKNINTVRFEWLTKHVCTADTIEEGGKSGWGFFTWVILVGFLGTAAYLIFGSWLNYNRYGARGWDLLPHGDTIRDVPYLLRDWSRKVVDTIQGGGSRGGYSAV